MLKRFTAKSVLIVFTIGILCVALSGPGVSLSKHGFANPSLPTGCVGKIPLLPGTKSQRSGVVCSSDQLFDVLSGWLALAHTHDFSNVVQLGMGMVLVDGFDGIASLIYLFYGSLTYPLPKVPLYLFNSVLTV
jgi:hypothetical protein